MGSRSTVITTDQTRNDASSVSGLNAARIEGSGNTVQMLDGDAIKNSLLFAQSNADGTAKTMADVLALTGSMATQFMENAKANTAATLSSISAGQNSAIKATQDAYVTAANSGVKPEYLVLAVVALAGLALIMKKRG